jgi:acyl-CoA dehydrogenase
MLFLSHRLQIHGGAGVSQDVVLGHLFATARTLRIADGPDEVHLGTLAKLELEAAAGGPAALRAIMGRARL